MPKHGIDQLCNSLTQALVSPRMALNKFPSPYATLTNIIVSMTLQLDTPWSKLSLI